MDMKRKISWLDKWWGQIIILFLVLLWLPSACLIFPIVNWRKTTWEVKLGYFYCFLLFLPLMWVSVASWVGNSAGVVSIKGHGPVNLVGVPGDEINFRLYPPDSAEYWSSSDGINMHLQNSEYEVEKEVAIVKPGEKVHDYFLGSFTVPQTPGGGPLILTGAISGDVAIGAKQTFLEVPVTLKVVPLGEGVTTGKKERQTAWKFYFIGLAAYMAALPSWLAIRAAGKKIVKKD